MKKIIKTVVYDHELGIEEAYCFEGMSQPFPSHFHEYYVIGHVEKGKREPEYSRRGRCEEKHTEKLSL